MICNSDKNNLPSPLILRLMAEVCNAQVSLRNVNLLVRTYYRTHQNRICLDCAYPRVSRVSCSTPVLFVPCLYVKVLLLNDLLQPKTAFSRCSRYSKWYYRLRENIFVNLDSPSFAFVFLDNGIKKNCDFVLFVF